MWIWLKDEKKMYLFVLFESNGPWRGWLMIQKVLLISFAVVLFYITRNAFYLFKEELFEEYYANIDETIGYYLLRGSQILLIVNSLLFFFIKRSTSEQWTWIRFLLVIRGSLLLGIIVVHCTSNKQDMYQYRIWRNKYTK